MSKNDFQCNAHQGESPLIYSVKSNVLQSYVFRMNKKVSSDELTLHKNELIHFYVMEALRRKKKKKSHLKFIIYYLKARPDIDSLSHCTVPNYSEYLILEMYHIYQNVRIHTSKTSSNLGKKEKKSKQRTHRMCCVIRHINKHTREEGKEGKKWKRGRGRRIKKEGSGGGGEREGVGGMGRGKERGGTERKRGEREREEVGKREGEREKWRWGKRGRQTGWGRDRVCRGRVVKSRHRKLSSVEQSHFFLPLQLIRA